MIVHMLSGISGVIMIRRWIVLSIGVFALMGAFVGAAMPVESQSGGCGLTAPVATGVSEHTLESGGIERFYIVYVPMNYDRSSPVPLVLTMHGLGGRASQQQDYSGWDTVAEREGFISVHPQGTGLPRRWHAYQHDMPLMPLGKVDDVQFFHDLIDTLKAAYCIDSARVYVNGLSNGGGMSYRLACDSAFSEQIAAVGIVAGAVGTGEDVSCWLLSPVLRPVPLIAFHGTDDPIVPYEGTPDLAAAQTWVEGWAQRNGCDETPEALPAAGHVSGTAYTGCSGSGDVVFYTIQDGGHTWPGATGRQLPGFLVGAKTDDVNATELIWSFFAAHPLD